MRFVLCPHLYLQNTLKHCVLVIHTHHIFTKPIAATYQSTFVLCCYIIIIATTIIIVSISRVLCILLATLLVTRSATFKACRYLLGFPLVVVELDSQAFSDSSHGVVAKQNSHTRAHHSFSTASSGVEGGAPKQLLERSGDRCD